MTLLGRVLELWRYPVSSMGGERIAEAELRSGGIPGDRIWGVMDMRSGEVAGPEKRRHWRPLLSLLSRLGTGGPEIGRGDGQWLPAGSPEAKELVSTFLDFPVELRPHSPFAAETEVQVAPRYQRDDIHLLTTASMKTLASFLADARQVDTRRFRPNIVVETADEIDGFAEHAIIGRSLQVGEALISLTEPCARCTFTAVAQGELSFEPAVLHNIARHGGGGFGVLCAVESAGKVRLGDDVRLVEG